MPTVQRRNAELVDLMATDFQLLRDPLLSTMKSYEAIRQSVKFCSYWIPSQISGSTLPDASVYGNTLTRENFPPFDKHNAAAIGTFSSASSHAWSRSAFANGTGNLCAGGWFRIDTWSQANFLMGLSQNTVNTNSSWRMFVGGGDALRVDIISGSTRYEPGSPGINMSKVKNTNQWFYVGLTFAAGSYISTHFGVEDEFKTFTIDSGVPATRNNATGVDFTIGRDGSGSPSYADMAATMCWVATSETLDDSGHNRIYEAGYHNFY